jgi:hypothetical protein
LPGGGNNPIHRPMAAQAVRRPAFHPYSRTFAAQSRA